MAKGFRVRSASELLYSAGEALHFAPANEFAPARSDKDTKEKKKPLLAYRLKVKTALARMCEQSFFLSLYSNFIRGLFNTRVRSFSVLFFSCGFLQILSYFIGVYLPFAAGDENNLVHGVTLIFLTLLCSFTRGDVKDVLKKSFLYRVVLAPLFGSEGWEFPNEKSGDNFLVMTLTGAALAFFAVIFSPQSVLLVTLFLALLLFILYQPEAGLVTVALVFLAVPFRITAFLIIATLISFLFKCCIGKRTLTFSLKDLPVMLLLLLLMFSANSRTLCLVLCALYLLALGLFKTLASVRRFMCALMLGGVFCSLMIFTRFIVTTFFAKLLFRFPALEELLFLEAESQVIAVLAMVCPLAVGFFRSLKTGARLFFSPLVLILFLAAIFCGASPSVWISLLIALVVQGVMTYRYALIGYLVLGMTFVSVWNLTPQKQLDRFLAFFGFSEGAQAATQAVSVADGIMLAGLFCFFIWSVIRFAAKATRAEAFPRVLGAISALLTFFIMWLCGVGMNENALILLVALLSVPRVCLVCSQREEVRLPY